MKKCPYSQICGGCNLQGVPYEEQLAEKQIKIKQLYNKYKVEEIMGMDDPYFYRNKVQYAFGKDYKGRIIYGNYVESTHKIVPIDKCQIVNDAANKIISSIYKLIISFKLSVFDENTYKGLIRHVLIRMANSTNEIMVVLVTGTFMFPRKNDFIRVLLKQHPEITTIVQNVNNKRTSMVLGECFETLYGKGYIEDILCSNRFKISPNSFYQVNCRQTEKLYNKAIELAQLKKEDVVIDAYCGIGTIGMSFAKNVKKVMSVEINKQAIKDAKINAKINNIENVDFYCDDAGKFMQKKAYEKDKIDVVIMDPARSGSDNKFLYALEKLKPSRVVYISCNPLTQKRDIEYLTKRYYKVQTIQPVDMFPFTTHVETIVLMHKK